LRHRIVAAESAGTFTESLTVNETSARPWSIRTPVTLPTTTPATFTLSSLRRPLASSNAARNV